jgi:hypothetical protein
MMLKCLFVWRLRVTLVLQREFRMAPDLDMFGQFSSDFVGNISIFVLAPILEDEHSILKSS